MIQRLLPILLVLASTAGGHSAGESTPARGLPVGAPAPNITFEQWYNYDGGGNKAEMTLHELRGRVVLLKFWRSW